MTASASVLSILGRLAAMLALLVWSPSQPSQTSASRIRTVFLILLENHSWSSIGGNLSAPYINRTLLPEAALAKAYYTPHGNHPSLPNYLWLEAGTNFGVKKDLSPAKAEQRTTAHLTRLLSRAGISWRAYEQSISGKVCPLSDSYPYATRHNPMVYFNDVTNRLDAHSAYCITHERPLAQLASDLTRNTVARYNFITPDVCHDMHDSCRPIRNAVKQGDVFLSLIIPEIVASRAYRDGGAIFITWDEGTNDGDGPMGLLALSPLARRGYTSLVRYTHSSTLRTIEEIFGLKTMLGGAARSNDLRDLFTTAP